MKRTIVDPVVKQAMQSTQRPIALGMLMDRKVFDHIDSVLTFKTPPVQRRKDWLRARAFGIVWHDRILNCE